MGTLQKQQNERTMARTRFEDEKVIPVGAKAQQNQIEGVQEGGNFDMVPASAFNNKNPHTIRFIDPNLSQKQAIKRI